MKRVSVIHVSFPRDDSTSWESIVGEYCNETKWFSPSNELGRPFAFCRFDTGDPNYERFLSVLGDHHLDWTERIEHVYSDAELRSFSLLRVRIERKEISPSGPSHGTTYDQSKSCPTCGTGAIQTSPFYAPPHSFPKSGLICQSSTETFVAERLADALQIAAMTGAELRQVRSHRDHAPIPWWQLIPKHTMPKLSPATKGIIRSEKLPPCPQCGRDGHYYTITEPEELAYEVQTVDPTLPDVTQTWECFGVSRIDHTDFKLSRIAAPAILVKPRVFDIFRRLKVKHAVFAPVRFV